MVWVVFSVGLLLLILLRCGGLLGVCLCVVCRVVRLCVILVIVVLCRVISRLVMLG